MKKSKKVLIILIVILSFIIFAKTIKTLGKIFYEYCYYSECLEDGNCKEGVTMTFGGKKVVINEKTCIEYNGKWKDNWCTFR